MTNPDLKDRRKTVFVALIGTATLTIRHLRRKLIVLLQDERGGFSLGQFGRLAEPLAFRLPVHLDQSAELSVRKLLSVENERTS